MTRDELLKKCVDKGVADESTVAAVSHLFYVFLLSALQRGQRVEIPDFGTFGTRVVGVKRSKKIPYFEPDTDLAARVNERFREMKYLVVGRYEEIPAVEGTEYTGRPAPVDSLVDRVGKEVVLDTHHEVSADEYDSTSSRQRGMTSIKEKAPMPKFDLKGEGMEETPKGGEPRPILHGGAEEGKGSGAFLKVLIAVLALAIVALLLHFFGVIRLWGPGKTEMAKLPEPVVVPRETPAEPAPAKPEVRETPTPVPAPKPTPAPSVSSTGGRFTVQVSSWQSRSKANEEVAKLTAANFDAFVEEGIVDGETWQRVRVGRFATRQEAVEAAGRLKEMLEDGAWVTTVRK